MRPGLSHASAQECPGVQIFPPVQHADETAHDGLPPIADHHLLPWEHCCCPGGVPDFYGTGCLLPCTPSALQHPPLSQRLQAGCRLQNDPVARDRFHSGHSPPLPAGQLKQLASPLQGIRCEEAPIHFGRCMLSSKAKYSRLLHVKHEARHIYLNTL